MKAWISLSLALIMCTLLGACSETVSSEKDTESGICKALNCSVACCNDQCVDTSSSRLHCGQCNTPCNGQCINGNCRVSCLGKICEGRCIDTDSDPQNCGACHSQCAENMKCQAGQCVCIEGHSSCDGKASTGCETYAYYCDCTPGETRSCYSGPAGTENVGICRTGWMTCIDGMSFGNCEGEVLPTQEIPFNGLDDNCNGEIDEDSDEDGDGWTVSQGDCCDNPIDCKVDDPARVNPAAYDVPGNGIDDDCDGIIDNPPSRDCSTTEFRKPPKQELDTNDALKLAKAMDICQTVTAESRLYGLISAELLLANGEPLPATGNAKRCNSSSYTTISPAEQVAVIKKLGQMIPPKSGDTMAVLSSGKAQGNENTGLRDCAGTAVKAPQVFLDAHRGVFPSASSCNMTDKGSIAKDSVMLRLKMRAPSNANGFSFDFRFFSKEYPNYVCGDFNDFFLALLDSKHPDIPEDHNISFDSKGNPVSVNNAFFSDSKTDVKAYIKASGEAGATAWLTTSSPVLPNEIFTLDLLIFDAGEKNNETLEDTNTFGHIRDSLVLLDNFQWRTEPTTLVTVIN